MREVTGPVVHADIYWARVTTDAVQAFTASLSVAERDRMARFHFERDRAAYAVAHGLLRRVLGRDLAGSYSGDFVLGPHGKPALAGTAGPHFNLSHAHGMVAVAICPAAPVGVDVEDLSRPLDGRALAASVLSRREMAALDRSGWQSGDFLARWVTKEALAKAAGYGLHADFREICLAGDPLAIVALPADFTACGPWSVSQTVVGGHIIAAAVNGADASWTYHEC